MRLSEHNSDLRERTCTSKVLFDEYGVDTCSLEEIEKVDLDKRYERERFWIENTENCVNRYLPGRTQAERGKAYYLANKDRLSEYHKAYKLANRERVLERGLEYAKAYALANSDKIKARTSERITCPTCGQNLARASFARHNKRRHL
jgi:hypothetical protein